MALIFVYLSMQAAVKNRKMPALIAFYSSL